MAKSFKTLNPNDRILPALWVKFTLIFGRIIFWTDVLTQVCGLLTNKALTLSKLNSQSRSFNNNKRNKLKLKQISSYLEIKRKSNFIVWIQKWWHQLAMDWVADSTISDEQWLNR